MNVKNSHKTFSAFDVFNECQPYSHKGPTSNFNLKKKKIIAYLKKFGFSFMNGTSETGTTFILL